MFHYYPVFYVTLPLRENKSHSQGTFEKHKQIPGCTWFHPSSRASGLGGSGFSNQTPSSQGGGATHCSTDTLSYFSLLCLCKNKIQNVVIPEVCTDPTGLLATHYSWRSYLSCADAHGVDGSLAFHSRTKHSDLNLGADKTLTHFSFLVLSES